jgi:hypothetical protein
MLADYSAKPTVGAPATPFSIRLNDRVRAISRLRFNLVRKLVQRLDLTATATEMQLSVGDVPDWD